MKTCKTKYTCLHTCGDFSVRRLFPFNNSNPFYLRTMRIFQLVSASIPFSVRIKTINYPCQSRMSNSFRIYDKFEDIKYHFYDTIIEGNMHVSNR